MRYADPEPGGITNADPRILNTVFLPCRFCQRMLNDLGHKIKRSKERLLLTQMEQAAANGVPPDKQEQIEEQINILTDKINVLVDQAEQAGCKVYSVWSFFVPVLWIRIHSRIRKQPFVWIRIQTIQNRQKEKISDLAMFFL